MPDSLRDILLVSSISLLTGIVVATVSHLYAVARDKRKEKSSEVEEKAEIEETIPELILERVSTSARTALEREFLSSLPPRKIGGRGTPERYDITCRGIVKIWFLGLLSLWQTYFLASILILVFLWNYIPTIFFCVVIPFLLIASYVLGSKIVRKLLYKPTLSNPTK